MSKRIDLPVFRIDQNKCYTGREFNEKLRRLTKVISERITKGTITAHSFRAGVSSEMCRSI